MNSVAYQDHCVLLLSGDFAYPVHVCNFVEVVVKKARPSPTHRHSFLMVWDAFQEHVSCILRRGGRRGLGIVLTPSHAFSADSFRSAMLFPTHPLTFSSKRFGLVTGHNTAYQVVHTPARILLQRSAYQFSTPGHVVPMKIINMGSTRDIFSNHFWSNVSLN